MQVRILSSLIVATLAMTAFPLGASAQTAVWQVTLSGPNVSDYAICPADFDGGGTNEISYYDFGAHVGHVISGETGAPILSISFPPGDLPLQFPIEPVGDHRFICVGDVDGDGNQDAWVRSTIGSRIVRLTDGVVVWSGTSVPGILAIFNPVPIGDFDSDGADDVLARVQTVTGVFGLAVYSPSNDVMFYTVFPTSPTADGIFGRGVVRLGDVDSDGVDDYACANHSSTSVEEVLVFSGLTGNVLATITPTTTAFRLPGAFGCSMVSVGDVNGDGIEDLGVYDAGVMDLVTFAFGEFSTYAMPTAALLSVRSWPNLPSPQDLTPQIPFVGPWDCPFRFGFVNGGDVDGDGKDELFIRSTTVDVSVLPLSISGSLVSGETGDLLTVVVPYQLPNYPIWRGALILPDLTVHAEPDLLVWRNTPGGFFGVPGVVGELRRIDMKIASADLFHSPCSDVAGLTPRIGASTDRLTGPIQPGDSLQINLSNVAPGSRANLIIGGSNSQWGALPLPLVFGPSTTCALYVRPDVVLPSPVMPIGPIRARSSFSSGPLPAGLAGFTFYAQWIIEDPAIPNLSRFSASAGLSLQF